MTSHSIQLTFYIFYEPDNDLIGLKHAALFTRFIGFFNKMFVLELILYCIDRCVKYGTIKAVIKINEETNKHHNVGFLRDN